MESRASPRVADCPGDQFPCSPDRWWCPPEVVDGSVEPRDPHHRRLHPRQRRDALLDHQRPRRAAGRDRDAGLDHQHGVHIHGLPGAAAGQRCVDGVEGRVGTGAAGDREGQLDGLAARHVDLLLGSAGHAPGVGQADGHGAGQRLRPGVGDLDGHDHRRVERGPGLLFRNLDGHAAGLGHGGRERTAGHTAKQEGQG